MFGTFSGHAGIEHAPPPTLSGRRPSGSIGRTAAESRKAEFMAAQESQPQGSKESRPSDSRVQALLKEYELSKSNADHLEESIWNTAAVLVTGSIAGMALLGGTIPDDPRPYDYLLRASVGALSVILVYWWKKMASVWYFIQNMLYYRVVEIEEELDLYSERYILFIDRVSRGEKVPENPGVKAMIAAMKDQYKPLIVPQTVNRIGWLLIFIWLIFLASQLAAMVGWL